MLTNPSTGSDNRQRVWKYVLVGVIALVGLVVLADATLTTSNKNNGGYGLDRRSALQGRIGNLMGDNESLEVAADTTYFVIESGDFGSVKQRCEAKGGKLASIRTEKQNRQVKDKCGGGHCYIGLRRSGNKFKWMDHSNAYVYPQWAPGEPNNAHQTCKHRRKCFKGHCYSEAYDCKGGEACVEMYSGGRWNDISCSTHLRAICQKPLRETPSDRYFLTTNAGDFKAVRKQCRDNGGELASLKSSTDVPAAQSVCGGNRSCYIGLTDHKHNGGWTWVDGTSLGWPNWSKNAPNNFHNNCVEMKTWNGKWNDVPCSNNLHGICKHNKKGGHA